MRIAAQRGLSGHSFGAKFAVFAPGVLALTHHSYTALYLVAGGCAALGAVAIMRVKRAR